MDNIAYINLNYYNGLQNVDTLKIIKIDFGAEFSIITIIFQVWLEMPLDNITTVSASNVEKLRDKGTKV